MESASVNTNPLFIYHILRPKHNSFRYVGSQADFTVVCKDSKRAHRDTHCNSAHKSQLIYFSVLKYCTNEQPLDLKSLYAC